MRYLAKIIYDGSMFYGFQRLNDLRTVQRELEEKLSILAKEKVIVKGAGRTDAHVHALGQYFHFDLNYDFEEEKLKKIINKLLSNDLKVKEIKKVDKKFHARLCATGKWYRYKIKIGEFNPFFSNYMYQVNYNLNFDKMSEASKLLIGKHDFHNFTAGYRDNYVGEISDIKINVNGDYIDIDFYGKGFYRYMVRNFVGTLLMIGQGKYDKDVIIKMLDPDKDCQSITAPAYGLYLMNVFYEKE